MNRGKRGSKVKKSTLRANLVKMGTATTSIVFGVPHLAVFLIGREIARTEGAIVSLIHWQDKVDAVADMRAMKSSDHIETMENFIDDTGRKCEDAIKSFVSSINPKKKADASS